MCYELNFHFNYKYILQMTWFHQHMIKNLGDTFFSCPITTQQWLRSPWLLGLHSHHVHPFWRSSLSVFLGTPGSWHSHLSQWSDSLHCSVVPGTRTCSPIRASSSLRPGCLMLPAHCYGSTVSTDSAPLPKHIKRNQAVIFYETWIKFHG